MTSRYAFALPCIVLGVLATACATSGDPQDPATETDASVTATFTTGGSDDTPPDPSADDDADDDGGPSTGRDDTTGGGTGTGTGDSTGATTGCEDGTEGCACLDAEPACADGLLCEDDMCVAPMCPADEDEPNDLQSETIHVVDVNDGAPPQQLAGVLSGTQDVDWWSYHCADELLEEVEPVSQLTAAPMPRLCVFMDCDVGGNPILASGCPAGTVEDQAPTGFLPGCCAADGAQIDLGDFNCPDSDDESITVLFRVDDGPEDACIDYVIDFGC
jgi:hypothetical protein